MSEIQMILLKMLKWFHNYCAANDIQYYVVGGTLLGAVRHSGFIPWDDDIDIALPRPDYEKLLSTFTEQIDDYYLETPYNAGEGFVFTFAKLYDTTTTFVEKLKDDCVRGVFIDIFPLDGMGSNEDECIKNFKKFSLVRNLYLTRVCATRKELAFYKNLAMLISRRIPDFLINNKKFSQLVDKKAKSFDYEESTFIANLSGAYGIKEMVPKEYLGKPTLYKFEDTEVFGVEKYDEYLSTVYNDWHFIPPSDKRSNAHNMIHCNLDKSYLDN